MNAAGGFDELDPDADWRSWDWQRRAARSFQAAWQRRGLSSETFELSAAGGNLSASALGQLQERLRSAQPALNTDELIQKLAARLDANASRLLKWVRASVGATVRLIPVDDIDYLRSDEKYTVVAYRDENGKPQEAVQHFRRSAELAG